MNSSIRIRFGFWIQLCYLLILNSSFLRAVQSFTPLGDASASSRKNHPRNKFRNEPDEIEQIPLSDVGFSRNENKNKQSTPYNQKNPSQKRGNKPSRLYSRNENCYMQSTQPSNKEASARNSTTSSRRPTNQTNTARTPQQRRFTATNVTTLSKKEEQKRLRALSEAVMDNVTLAQELLESFLDEVGTAPRLAYEATIRAWLSNSNDQKALQVVQWLEEDPKHKVSAKDYRPIVQYLIQQGQPYQAIQLVNQMAYHTTQTIVLDNKEYFTKIDPKRQKRLQLQTCSAMPDARCFQLIVKDLNQKKVRDRQRWARLIYEWASRNQQTSKYLFHATLLAHEDARDMDRWLLLWHSTNKNDTSQHTEAICYVTVISAYFRQTHIPQRGRKMESVLKRLEQHQVEGVIQPDEYTYRQILEAYTQVHDARNSVRFFQQVLVMETKKKLNVTSAYVDLLAKRVLDAIAKSRIQLVEAEQMICTILECTDAVLQKRNETITVDLYHFAMDTMIRARKSSSLPVVQSLYSQLLRECRVKNVPALKPNTKSLNIVLKAYSTCGDPQKMEIAERILLKMEESFAANQRTNQSPDVISYTTLIQGWLSCKSPDSMPRAEFISKRMYAMYEAGNEAAKPDQVSTLSLMRSNLWRAPSHKPLDEQVAACLNQSPADLITLGQLMRQWGSDGGAKAEQIVDRLLRKYEHTSDDGDLPDSYIWTAAISAWGRSPLPVAAQKAELILDKLILLYGVSKHEKLRPHVKNFEAVIRAYSQPNQPDKAKNAKRILDRMIELQSQGVVDDAPSRRDALTAVLKACSHAKGINFNKPVELEIASNVYQQIRDEKLHNEATYAAYIGALRNCMERAPSRSKLLGQAFDECRSDGYVDAFVLEQMKRSLHPKEMMYHVGSNVYNTTTRAIDGDAIPKYWRRNIQQWAGRR